MEDALLERIRALLAKAESSDYPAEAESFTEKAHELMAAHAIDQLALEHDTADGPEIRELLIEAPYVRAKYSLLAAVAGAHRCQVVLQTHTGRAHLAGYGRDLEGVELLYTSLLLQAVQFMQREGSRQDYDGRNRTRSFRRAFLLGFAARIGARLRESTAHALDAAAHDQGQDLLPVLVAREEEIDSLVRARFPFLRNMRSETTNGAGLSAGRSAADTATLGSPPIGGSRPGLGPPS